MVDIANTPKRMFLSEKGNQGANNITMKKTANKSNILSRITVPNACDTSIFVPFTTECALSSSPSRNTKTELPKYPIIVEPYTVCKSIFSNGSNSIFQRYALMRQLTSNNIVAMIIPIRFTLRNCSIITTKLSPLKAK